MVTLEQANTMKKYVKEQMDPDRWIEVNEKQMEVFKYLIFEQYGWPEFTLNINNSGDKVMKIMVW
jgi:hypothetical protein